LAIGIQTKNNQWVLRITESLFSIKIVFSVDFFI